MTLTVIEYSSAISFLIPGSEQLKADLQRSGVEYRNEEGDLDFHALRYTFGHWLVTMGCGIVEIQAILRHSDPNTTARHYVNVVKLSESKGMEELFEEKNCTPESGSEGPELLQRDTNKLNPSR